VAKNRVIDTQMEDRGITPPRSVVPSPHWLILFKGSFVSQHSTRKLAEDCVIETHKLPKELAEKLRRSLVKIPRVGVVVITSCDCTDGKHEDEL
jgi:hypothetical protein